MADTETNTNGGPVIGGGVETGGGGFTGRDRNTFNSYGDLSYAISDISTKLALLTRRVEEIDSALSSNQQQYYRLKENVEWELRDIGKDLDKLKDEHQALVGQVANSQRTPTGTPPSTALLWLILGGVAILVIVVISVAIYWSLRSGGGRLSLHTSPLGFLYVYFMTSISYTYFWQRPT